MQALPANIYCLDSLRAFLEIDKDIQNKSSDKLLHEINKDQNSSLEDVLNENSKIDWKTINENTPKRATANISVAQKRKLLASGIINFEETPLKRPTFDVATEGKSRRCLFSSPQLTTPKHLTKMYPPKGLYKLNLMYERIFGEKPEQSHYAEADVNSLVKLLQYYGRKFVNYAEENAVEFNQMPKLHEMH